MSESSEKSTEQQSKKDLTVGIVTMAAIVGFYIGIILLLVMQVSTPIIGVSLEPTVNFNETGGEQVVVSLEHEGDAEHVYVRATTANQSDNDFSGGLRNEYAVDYLDAPVYDINRDGLDEYVYNQFLVSGPNGGTGKTVTVDVSNSAGGEIEVIVVNKSGEEEVIDSYEYVSGIES